jgi:hypothetical protein
LTQWRLPAGSCTWPQRAARCCVWSDDTVPWGHFMVLLIENSRSCAGKWLYTSRLWSCSRRFTTLKGIAGRLQ